MAAVTVRKVESASELKTFVEFPWTIYKDDPNWVPPLVSQWRTLFDKEKNPSWEYLQGDYFIAWQGSQPVGTVAGFINPRHNQTWDENVGWFGAFECINDQEVANALLNTAADYVRTRANSSILRGPATFTCNDQQWGLLIDNFSEPVLLMPYNRPYYQQLIENSGLGLNKVMDLFSFFCDARRIPIDHAEVLGRYKRVTQRSMERHQITLRKPVASKLKQELALLRDVYEQAWERNWGNVPPTDHEMDHLFTDLKDYFDPELAVFAYVKGELAGFFFSLPDMNEVLKRADPNPSTPELITLLRALWHWKIRPVMTRQRCLLLGVKPQYRGLGVDVAMFLNYFDQSTNSSYPLIDAGWVLETNEALIKLLTGVSAQAYKKYRIYQTAL
ncbi:MAG: hypothetical protein U0528_14710 [Anaerolineae bacterium]